MKAAGIFFVTGLIMAASDGPWFPWPNIAGVVIFSLSPMLALRAERRLGRR